jgi:hypothetical protein
MSSPSEILKRFKKAHSRKTNWETLYEDAQDYVAPQRETFDYEEIGTRKDGSDTNVYDSTAQNALLNFASNLQSSLVPPMKRWIELKPAPNSGLPEPDASNALERITEIMFQALSVSNFDTQVAESFLDLGFGTGAFLVFAGDEDSPFEFVNVPLSQIFLEEGPHGRIETAFRKFKLPARVVEKQWPDLKITSELSECMSEDPDKLLNFVEATIPQKVSTFDPQANESREVDGYEYSVVWEDQKQKIVSREMNSSPWIIFRWANLPGEIYGRGPVLTALPDIKSLNKVKELLLQSASIAAFGMYTVADDGVINTENIEFGPGALIPVSSNPGSMQGPTLAPLAVAGDVNLTQFVIQDLQNSINKMMFGDPLGDVTLPVKTATEISLRQQDLAKRIGSAFGKLQFELITPLVNRLLDILDELGLIDLGDFRVDGKTLAIEHISPLAQAQDEEDIIKMVRYAETMVNLFGPQVSSLAMKPDMFGRKLAEKLNISMDVLPTEEEVEQIKGAAAQALANQQGV